jgi:hypothetical protein
LRKRFLAVALLPALLGLSVTAQRRIPADLSGVRGFNYQSAETKGHVEHWLQYNPAVTVRDLDYAERLQLNQVRVLVPQAAWEKAPEAFNRNLLDFVRAAHARGIGVMPAMQYNFGYMRDRNSWASARPFIADLVATIGKEPGLAMWDVENEPDCCSLPVSPMGHTRMEHAMYVAGIFHELDPVTPVTIGVAFVPSMIETAAAVDVLSFHDYSTTRAEIRANISKASQFATQTKKALIDSEMGCIARANPYDVMLEEYMHAHVGWYIWELMITGQWGTVHGVFYPDGTVRDPAIAAAVLGFFRNRGAGVIEDVPDREIHLTEVVAKNKTWIAQANPDWSAGLDLAEVSANLLEAAQLAPMHVLPSREVLLLRAGAPNLPALRTLLQKFTAELEPYQLSPDDPRRSRPLNLTHPQVPPPAN